MYPHVRPWMASVPLSTKRRAELHQILIAAGVAPLGPCIVAALLGRLREPEHLSLLKPSSTLSSSGGKAYELMAQCYAPSIGSELAARFLEDLTKELRQQCTNPFNLVYKRDGYLDMENYCRVLFIIDPLVEQVQQEILNHFCSFKNVKKIHDILLIIEVIAYQKRELLSENMRVILGLEDIQIMSDCLFHFMMEVFNDPNSWRSAASRKQALSQIVERSAMDSARAHAIPGATSASSFLPPFPRSVPVVSSSQASQPLDWGVSDPWPNDLSPESHLPRGVQVQTEPQSALHTENPSSSLQQFTPCQTMAEALKRYTESNTATKAECHSALTKQEEARQQLEVAFSEFLHSEAVLHDQAEQTFSALFDTAGSTNNYSTYLRSPGDTSAAPPSCSAGAPSGSRAANAQGRWSSAILTENLSPQYTPPAMYPQFAPLHPSPPNNANFMNPPALGPNSYSYSPPYPVPPPLGNIFTPPDYPNTTGSFQTLSPYVAWPMSVGPGAYYSSTISAPQTFRHAQPPYGGASASFGTPSRWQNKMPHCSTSNWKAPITPTIPVAASHTAPYANAASRDHFVSPTGSPLCDTRSPYYPFYTAFGSSQRSPRTHPAALFTPPPPPPVPRVPDSADNSRSTSPYINLPDLSSYVMPPFESSSDIPALRKEFSDDGTSRREPLSPITERTSQAGSEAGNGEEHRVRIVESTRSPYLPRAPEAPGHSSNAHGNGMLGTISPSVSSPIYVVQSPTPPANTPHQPSRVEVDSSVSELVTDSEPSVLSSPTSDNALFCEAERGGWYFPAFPPGSPLVINSVPVTVPPSPSPQNCGSTPISVSPPPGVRDYETTDTSRSTSSPIASSASNPLPPSQLSTQLQFSHLFCDDNHSHPPPTGAIIPPPLPPSSSERIEKIKGRFDGLKQAFSFPRFVDVSMDGSTSKTVDTTALYAATLMECALNNGNHPSMLTGKRYRMLPFGSEGGRRVHRYSKDLDDVLLELDGVWCGDDAAAKAKRKEVVDEVVKEANVLDQWKDMICKMADVQQ